MDVKDTLRIYKSDETLLTDSAYYKFIFKKTEKIVCAVFYLIEHTDKKGQNAVVTDAVCTAAKQTLDHALRTLACRWYAPCGELHTFLHTLVALASSIRLARSVALIEGEIADLLSLEIETVLRGLRQYIGRGLEGVPDLMFMSSDDMPHDVRHTRDRSDVRARGGQRPSRVPESSYGNALGATDAHVQAAGAQNAHRQGQSKGHSSERRRTIKDTLAGKGQLTIKDISEQVPEYSEKTIQREVIAMVNEGQIIKEGERRWTRYSLSPGA